MNVRKIIVGNLYKHFKGNIYKVICLAKDSETQEDKVVYQDIKDISKIWVRDYDMFNSLVDKEKYPNVKEIYRFEELKHDN